MKPLKIFLYVFILAQLFFSWNNHLPTWFWFQEVSINFGAYWLALHLATIVLLLCLRRRLRGSSIALVFLIGFSASYIYQLRTFILFAPPVQSSSVSSHRLRVVLASADCSGADLIRLKALLESEKPEVIGLLGVNAAAVQALSLAQQFPYAREVVREDGFGIGLYSRYSLVAPTQTSVGELLPPIVSTSLVLNDAHALPILLFHAPSPFERENFHNYKLLVRRTSTPLRQSSGPLLVFGNFSATEFSGSYKRFRNAGQLKDAMAGHGYYRTWDSSQSLLRLTLDHIMYRDIEVTNFRRLPDYGSAHYAISADFSW